jgi:methylenetetrahydrofolate dehydrogenase (NADP+)/methenyltetrahydrofolate cyclohydrolase
MLMAGGPLAERIRAQVARDVQELGGIGLATVQVGEDPASTVYIRRKHEAAGEAVIASTDLKLPEDISQEALVAAVELLNDDDEVDGILVQLPLPDHLDEAQAVLAIDPVKDVDGVHPFNAGQLYLGRPTLVPATPLGIMALLAEFRRSSRRRWSSPVRRWWTSGSTAPRQASWATSIRASPPWRTF